MLERSTTALKYSGKLKCMLEQWQAGKTKEASNCVWAKTTCGTVEGMLQYAYAHETKWEPKASKSSCWNYWHLQKAFWNTKVPLQPKRQDLISYKTYIFTNCSSNYTSLSCLKAAKSNESMQNLAMKIRASRNVQQGYKCPSTSFHKNGTSSERQKGQGVQSGSLLSPPSEGLDTRHGVETPAWKLHDGCLTFAISNHDDLRDHI